MDELNSSDFEDDPNAFLQPSRAAAGKRKNAAIMENQVKDRLDSKRMARNLTFIHGAPTTQWAQSRVENNFKTYLQTINHNTMDSVDSCPSGENIIRYAYNIVANTQSNLTGKGAPSLSTVQGIWIATMEYLKFRYIDFKKNYTSHEVKRVSVFFEQQVQLGNLTQGLWRRRQWLGLLMIQKLVTEYVSHQLLNGCGNFDTVILRTLGIVLQCACASRPGDVAKTLGYEVYESLRFGDVELVLQQSSTPATVQHLRGKVTLRFTKNKKRISQADEIKFFDPLTDPQQSLVCPIKMLLVLALRLGQTYGVTLDEVLEHTSRRHDRTIQWKNPDHPVLCLISKGRRFLQPNNPAPASQLSGTVKVMGLIAGILVPITSKDIRTGSAREIAHIRKGMRGTDHRAAALHIGHSEGSVQSGTTAHYIGALQNTVYNMRAADPLEDRLAPQQAAEGFVARRSRPAEIDQWILEHGGDVGDANARKRASLGLKTDAVHSWREREKDRTVEPSSSSLGQRQRPATTTLPLAKRQKTTSSRQDRVARLSLESSDSSSSTSATTMSIASKSTTTTSTVDIPDDLIDPALLSLDDELDQLEQIDCEPNAVDRLTSMIVCSGQLAVDDVDESDSAESAAAIDSQVQALLEAAPVGPSNSSIYLEGNAFVNYFAAYNIFRLLSAFDHTSEEEVSRYVPTGNSRSKPEPMWFSCGKAECEFRSIYPRKVVSHRVTCDGSLRTVDKPFRCSEEGCDKAFPSAQALGQHITGTHRWLPRACTQCPMSPDAHVFQSQEELSEHRDKKHNDLPEPQRCPLAQTCLSKKQYLTFPSLSEHLRKIHLLTVDQVALHMPEKVWKISSMANMPVIVCTMEGCESTLSESPPSFYGRFMLRLHLVEAHGMTYDQALGSVPDVEPPEKKGRPCPVPNCSGVFDKRAALQAHLINQRFHRMSEDDADEKVREVFGQPPKVQRRKGPSTDPKFKKCPLPACKSTTTFSSASFLARHLRLQGTHAMDPEEAGDLAREVFQQKKPPPKEAREAFQQKKPPPKDLSKSKRCPLPNCSSTALFRVATNLRKHLTSTIHGFDNDAARSLAESTFGDEHKRRKSPPKRSKSALVETERDAEEDEEDEDEDEEEEGEEEE